MNLVIVCSHPVDEVPGLRQWLRRVITGVRNEGEDVYIDLIEGPGAPAIGEMCRALGVIRITLYTDGKSVIDDFTYFDQLLYLPQDKHEQLMKEASCVLAFGKTSPVTGMGDRLALLDVGKPAQKEARTTVKVNPLTVVNDKPQPDGSVTNPYGHMDWVKDYQDSQKVAMDPHHPSEIPSELRERMAPRRNDPFYNE